MCMVFRYILQEELSPEMSSRSVFANFSCDFQNWCKGRQSGLIYYNVSVVVENTESVKGDLYCCDGNNCNMASVIRQLPPQQLCYRAKHYFGEDSYTGTVVSCSDPDAWCIRSRLFNTTPITTTYDCDNHQLCQHFNMTSGSSYVCRNVTQKSEKEEVCCCSSNVCFKPFDTVSSSIFGSPLTEQLDDRSAGIGIVTVGCIVAFTLLALVGGGVMVALMYQRRSQPSISALTLTYSRIEEDDVSDSVQML
ncbi:uncharacterized protein LOC112564031 [Pomacea canaliculata]|nr:uncharacterized protein LOC112564031 [Pomacea canaliculata]